MVGKLLNDDVVYERMSAILFTLLAPDELAISMQNAESRRALRTTSSHFRSIDSRFFLCDDLVVGDLLHVFAQRKSGFLDHPYFEQVSSLFSVFGLLALPTKMTCFEKKKGGATRRTRARYW